MEHLSWDIFADQKLTGSFWAAAQIAQQLSSVGETVRVFAGGLQSEQAPRKSYINIRAEQDLHIELFDLSKAHIESPAPRVIQVWGSKPPAEYFHKLMQRGSHWNFNLVAPNSPRMSPARLSQMTEMDSINAITVQMGGAPPHAAYLQYGRDLCRSPLLSKLYKDRRQHLSELGLPTVAQFGEYYVMISGEVTFDPCPFVRMLQATQRPMVLLVEPGSVQLALACAFGAPLKGGGCLQLGQLALIFLPEMTWKEQDQYIILSDLIVSSELSICWRACCLGTPLVFDFPESDQGSFLDWYCQDGVSTTHVLLKNLSLRLMSYADLPQAWQWYWSCLPDFEAHASAVQRRVVSGPDLINYLTEAVSSE